METTLTKTTGFTIFLFIVSLSLMLYQAFLPDYWKHLFVDIWAYHNRISYFAEHGSFDGIPFEEYQPGAILFFSLLLPWVNQGISAEQFGLYYIGLNCIVAGLFQWGLIRFAPKYAFIFPLVLAAGGPILLFRFELVVGLITAAALIGLQRNRVHWGMALLGLATAIKVYPILLLPVLLRRPYTKLLLSYVVGLMVPTGLFIGLFQSSLPEILSQLLTHSAKPINVESTLAIGLQAWKWITTQSFYPIELRIVFGLTAEGLPIAEKVAHSLWLLPYGIWCLWVRLNYKRLPIMELSYATLALVLLFSTQLAPQYMYWFIFLIPLFRHTLVRDLLVVIVLLLCTQFVYPVGYTALLNGFETHQWNRYFSVLIFRNILIGVSLYQIITQVMKVSHDHPLRSKP